MSLFNFGFKTGEGVKRDRPTDDKSAEFDSKLSKDQRYDKHKRTRGFLPHWKSDRPWLNFDEVKHMMFCEYCRKYPMISDASSAMVKGTSDLKLDPIKRHEVTKEHVSAFRHWLKDNDPEQLPSTRLSESKIGQSILKQNLTPDQINRYKILFNTAYSVAKSGKPFVDFIQICEIQRKNGLDVGTQYINIEGCKLFLKNIASYFKQNLSERIKKANFISIMSDGSTDHSVIEQEVVYVRFVENFMPVTSLINIMPLESGSAQGIFDAIKDALNSVGINLDSLKHDTVGPKLICGNFDGASVNFGSKSGVITRIKEVIPEVIGVHCIAHKLELSILDANKTFKYMTKFEDLVKGIFGFYFYSPKRRRELKEIGQFLDKELSHFSAIKQVRWLASKDRAVSALANNIEAVVMYLEHDFVSGSRADDANKAKGYHKDITSVHFLKVLYFMLDYLPIVAQLSQIFQHESYMIFELYDHIETAIMSLTELKYHEGKNMKIFLEMLDIDKKMFGSIIKLNPRGITEVDYKTDKELHDFIDGTITYIEKRFANLREKPLSFLSIFDFHKWPFDRHELSGFGNAELLELANSIEFANIFTENEKDELLHQWFELKLYLNSQRNNVLLTMYSLVLGTKANFRSQARNPNISPIEKLIEWLLSISPSTSCCERGFSKANVVKNKLRTVLSEESFQNQLYVMTEGPNFEDFKPMDSIKFWFENCSGTPHARGHKAHKTEPAGARDYETIELPPKTI